MTRQQKPEGQVGLVRKEKPADQQHGKRDDPEVDDLRQPLGLAVAALEHLAHLQRHHHRVDHQKGERYDRVFERGGIAQDPAAEPQHQHDGDGDEQVLVERQQKRPHRALLLHPAAGPAAAFKADLSALKSDSFGRPTAASAS